MPAATTTPTPIIDWVVLGKVLEYSLAFGLGLILVVSVSVIAFDIAKRQSASLLVRMTGWLATVVSLGVIVAAVAWGLYLIVHKS